MADLRIENPKTTEAFVEALAELDVKLPVNINSRHVGVVFDADGQSVFVVDIDGDRDDAQVTQIAQWIVLAINTCGGFRAERSGG